MALPIADACADCRPCVKIRELYSANWKKMMHAPNSPPHFFKPHVGQEIYHYTSADVALAILRSDTFWLTEYSKTNDSSEFTYARDRFLKTYNERTVWIEEIPRLLATTNLIELESETTMMIGCFSIEGDDLGQWKEYGDRGRGCVIGFDALQLKEECGVAIKKIGYDANDLSHFVSAGLAMLQGQYEERPEDLGNLNELAAFFVADLLAFKHPAFVQEREIRI
jgi:hypothetical protein